MENPTLCCLICGLRYLWTAAFGMGIIAEIPIRNRIKNIGSVR